MSYSLVEKQRKYTELLRREPTNNIYKTKVEKYARINGQYGGASQTDEILDKINNVLSYKPKVNKIKGYRDMIGGDLVAHDKPHESIENYRAIRETQKNYTQTVLDGVTDLAKTNKNQAEHIKKLEEELDQARRQQKDIDDNIRQLENDRKTLNEQKEILETRLKKGQVNKELETKSKETIESVNERCEDLSSEIETLKKRLEDVQEREQSVLSQLEDVRGSYNNLKKRYDTDIEDLGTIVDNYQRDLSNFKSSYDDIIGRIL